MVRKAAMLPAFQARVKAIDTTGCSSPVSNDHKLIEAERSGFDFNLRVLRPWARDPGDYQTILGQETTHRKRVLRATLFMT